MEDIRSATCALRQNILAVASGERSAAAVVDTLDQQDLTNRLHKFKVSQGRLNFTSDPPLFFFGYHFFLTCSEMNLNVQ